MSLDELIESLNNPQEARGSELIGFFKTRDDALILLLASLFNSMIQS